MDLKDIASVSGKSGLFLVVKPTRTGVILETIDAQKNKLIANASSRVSLLKEISIYTNGKESSILLEQVFKTIFEKYGKELSVSGKSSPAELHSFMLSVVPEYDTERVYTSDIKKITTWYATLMNFLPEKFDSMPKEDKSVKTEKVQESKSVVEETAIAKEKSESKVKPKAKASKKS